MKDLPKIEVLAGLPGSGKTTWAVNQQRQNLRVNYIGRERVIFEDIESKTIRLDMDAYMKANHKTKPVAGLYQDFFNEIAKVTNGKKKDWRIIIDGLFLTHEDYLRVAKTFRDYDITYHWWTPKRDICAYNDRYRRKDSSEDLIMNAEFEEPDPVALKLASASVGTIDKKQHAVKKKSGYQLFCDRYGLGRQFESESWSNGGTSYDCYGHSYNSSPDAPVSSFENFDELIERINENISFMKYKKLYNASVDSETKSTCGYYGGSRTESYLVCDTRKLYDALIENDLLPEEFI